MAIALFVVSFNILASQTLQKFFFDVFFGFRLEDSEGSVTAPMAVEFWDRNTFNQKFLSNFLSMRFSNLASIAYLVGMTAYTGKAQIQGVFSSLVFFNVFFYLNMYLNILVCFSTENKDESMVYLDDYGTILVYLFGGVSGIITGAINKTKVSEING